MRIGLITVLLIEDSEAHALLVEQALVGLDPPVRLVHVHDGMEAQRYLASEGKYAQVYDYPRPDFILLDLNLPGVDGFEIIANARNLEETRFIPLVVLSSSESHEDIARAYASGANAYLVKPIGFAAFREMLARTVRFWGESNRLP